jgi:hypothetical protein
MRHFRNTTDKESDRLNAFVAGSLAGLALILDRDKSRRRSIMLYLLTRALQFNGAWMMKKWDVKRRQDHPGQVKWDDRLAWFLRQFSGAGVMMLVSSQVIYALLFCPDTLPKSYFSFLLIQSSFKSKFGRKAPDMARLIGTSVNNIEKGTLVNKIPAGITSREFIAKFVSESASELVPPNLKHDYTICAIHHPATESCISDKAFTFREEFLRALNLYVPLNVVKEECDLNNIIILIHILWGFI